MKIDTKYICDRCGSTDHTNTLTITFQQPYDNVESAHFCDKCNEDFKQEFKRFTKIKNMVAKQGLMVLDQRLLMGIWESIKKTISVSV